MSKNLLVLFAAVFLVATAFSNRTKTPEASPPSLDFQIIPSRDTVMRGKGLLISVDIANKSNTELQALRVYTLDPDFPVKTALANIGPFESKQATLDLQPKTTADFAQHRILFILDYNWCSVRKCFHSARTTSITLTVQRTFDEEAKGLPGGTGALLYLLLPIMPAFLAFEFFNGLRKGEGFKMPTFSTDYVLPAFLLGLGVSYLAILVAKQEVDFAYSDPHAFAWMLLASVLVGAAIPLLLWAISAIKWSFYGFRDNDTPYAYLLKALRLNSQAIFSWKTGVAGGEQWQGLLLKQPNGKLVLGARMQISPGDGLTANQLRAVFNAAGQLVNVRQMERWLRDVSVTIQFRERIQRGQKGLEACVLTEGFDQFTASAGEQKRLIEVAQ
jgi:hypothetical protein